MPGMIVAYNLPLCFKLCRLNTVHSEEITEVKNHPPSLCFCAGPEEQLCNRNIFLLFVSYQAVTKTMFLNSKCWNVFFFAKTVSNSTNIIFVSQVCQYIPLKCE
uniref:Uncharacterized protein n=1 Tax=Sphaerodactylus townsendi TaxID=933632 RepID=A0ACB8EJF4_9SAUR